MEFRVQVHREEDHYWAEVAELPGCFATGDTLDELAEALSESIALYLDHDAGTGGFVPSGAGVVDELRIAVPA